MRRQASTRQRRAFIGTLVAGALSGALATVLLLPADSSARAQSAPRNTNQPTVYGTTVEGKTLFTTNGSWSGTQPMSFRYRWLRCDTSGGGANGVNCGTIPGETRRTYVLSHADVGHRIRSRVIATNADGTAGFNSNASAVIKAAPKAPNRPLNTQAPAISGNAVENQTLTASVGTWTGNPPISYAYQWRRCDQSGGSCSAISVATQKTYTLKTVDIGNTLRVSVTAKNSAGSRSVVSAPTAVVTKAEAPSGSAISISDVSLPNRLIIQRVSYRPNSLRSGRTVIARFRISDSRSHPVQGALVFVVGVPFGSSSTPPEAATGPDGYVTFALHPTRRALRSHSGIVFFVRARKPGEPLLAGVSTRRLTYLPWM
jgi:hypothetical protein